MYQMLKIKQAILPGLVLSLVVAIIAKTLALALPSLGGATLAILIGIILGNTFFKQDYLAIGTKFSESKLLECSVVLLGFTVTFQTISRLGLNGLIFIIAMMSIVIISARAIGKWLGFSENMGILMASGNAVCGSSAIGAVAPAIEADEVETGQSITLVNLLGTVMMLTLPILATSLFGKSLLAHSALLGGTLQSVGQVVAGASLINQDTVRFAMLFKITRILFLVVVVFIFQKRHQKQQKQVKTTKRSFPIPWYVLAFLIICVLNSLITFPKPFSDNAHLISTWFETIALAAIGLRLDLKKFIKEGPKFLIYGLSVGCMQTLAAIILIFLLKIG